MLVVALIGAASVWRSTSGAQAPGGAGQASNPAGQAAPPSVEAAGIPEAYAIYRVAEMRGDLTTALHREMMLGARLSGEQRLPAEAEALHLNLHLNALYRQKHGVDPPPVEMRPYLADPDDTAR